MGVGGAGALDSELTAGFGAAAPPLGTGGEGGPVGQGAAGGSAQAAGAAAGGGGNNGQSAAGTSAQAAGASAQAAGAAAGGGGNNGQSGDGASMVGAGSGDGAPATCSDSCPRADGVDWVCKLRFMYGINYAWHYFAGDFGGVSQWGQPGVAGNPAVARELAQLSAGGVSVVRWWVFPDFRGDGIAFDAEGIPTGLSGSTLEDVERALELAEEHNLYLMLTLFSFDNFRPTEEDSGVLIRSIYPMATEAAARTALLEHVVRPFARAVAESPYAQRVIAWDVINEPEWAVTGPSRYGDEDFDPNPDLISISHAQMESFIAAVIEVLRAESDSLISVGSAAMKWRNAWSQLDTDFLQFHVYDWVDQWWPYDRSPSDYGIDDRPVVMGEYPIAGLTRASYAMLNASWYDGGYGGSLAWAFTDGGGDLSPVREFAAMHACETRY